MRWDHQSVAEDRAARLPGYEEPVVRTFDAPEALDTRFHEIQARSALNRVPGAGTRLPFRWTVNPYRGCSHACTYCLHGDTAILMADGRTRRLADLQPGDRIYGTVRRGACRRYVRTEVLDHWSTVKPAYRVTLADGTELIASADHRFLSERGWKHVTGQMSGAGQRPYLTTGNRLLGTGGFAVGPEGSADYRRGYLCGLIRGDGHIGSYFHERAGRVHGEVHRFRLALGDPEALQRAERYLLAEGVVMHGFQFAHAAAGRRAIGGLPNQSRAGVQRVRELIHWPLSPSDDWRKGFLAGIFDAEGSCTAGTSALRIANGDRVILGWVEASLLRFGFDAVVDGPSGAVQHVRLRGGLAEQLRFFHLTDPAISRKRNIEGLALKSSADLRVRAIEPLEMALRLYDMTTGTGDFIANGVVSHNCFARPTHEYLDLDAGRDFEKEILVKVNVPEVLRAELARPSWGREHVALGTNTDPYQWVEKRYRLMRGIWEAMRDFANPCSILTKSPLVLRDADLLAEIGARTHVSACLSIPTWDEKAWRATEPHTPHPRARMEAVAELNRRGIATGILIAPLMPGTNDHPRQVEQIVEAADAAGATSVGGQALFLRGSTKDVFMGWMRLKRPDLVPEYERLYGRRAYLRPDDKSRVEAPLRAARRRSRLTPPRFERAMSAAEVAAGARAGGEPTGTDRPAAHQESLF